MAGEDLMPITIMARDETAAAFASFKRNALDSKAAVDQFGGAAQRNIRSHVDMSNAVDKATFSLGEQRKIFKTLAAEASLMGGPLGEIIGKTGLLTIGSQRLSLGITAGVLVFGALTAGVYKSVAAYVELEKHQATVANALSLTGGASGQTVA